MDAKQMFIKRAEEVQRQIDTAKIINRMIQENNQFIADIDRDFYLEEAIQATIRRIKDDNERLRNVAKRQGVAHLVK